MAQVTGSSFDETQMKDRDDWGAFFRQSPVELCTSSISTASDAESWGCNRQNPLWNAELLLHLCHAENVSVLDSIKQNKCIISDNQLPVSSQKHTNPWGLECQKLDRYSDHTARWVSRRQLETQRSDVAAPSFPRWPGFCLDMTEIDHKLVFRHPDSFDLPLYSAPGSVPECSLCHQWAVSLPDLSLHVL